MMKAVEITKFGGPKVLQVKEHVRPKQGPKEVLIKVAFAGINGPDLKQREGKYAPPPGVTDIPGLEVSGVIEAVGADVLEWKVGDKVCALVAGGGYAEYCVAPEEQVLAMPANTDFMEAAAIPESFFTVWTNVFDVGALKPDERFLVHGGSGGIGTTAIIMAKAWGAQVFVTARGKEKCKKCEEIGADHSIDSSKVDFVKRIQKFTNDHGVHVILDQVGGDFLKKNCELLSKHGRLVQVQFARGREATLDLLIMMQKHLVLTGSTLRPRSIEDKGKIAFQLKKHIWPFFKEGKIKPVIDSVFSFKHADKAHAYMESGKHFGKILLQF